jgi:hypothetical protein
MPEVGEAIKNSLDMPQGFFALNIFEKFIVITLQIW